MLAIYILATGVLCVLGMLIMGWGVWALRPGVTFFGGLLAWLDGLICAGLLIVWVISWFTGTANLPAFLQ